MNTINKLLFSSAMPLCLGMMLWGCAEPEYGTPVVEKGNFGQAQVRFVNAIADTNRIGLKVDNDTVSVSTLGFGMASDYTNTSAGANRQFRLGNTGFSVSGALLTGIKYTVVASGTYRNRRVNWQIIQDLFPAANGKAMIRFLNFSGLADTLRLQDGTINLFATPYTFRTKDKAGADSSFSRTLIGNRLFNATTESVRATVRGVSESQIYSLATFQPFDAGAKTWRVVQFTRRPAQRPVYPLLVNETFEAGRYYTVLVTGGNSGKPLSYTILTHN